MIKQQLRTSDILDENLLSLIETSSRDEFVPTKYHHVAFSDMQIPLQHNQRMLTPIEEGKILQSLGLKGHEVVLEIGTGTGYFTYLLSKLCKQVISVDYFADFTASAKKRLDNLNVNNVTLVTGDACRGWLEKAPYDIVIFTGAIEEVTKTHRLQVLPGGKLFVIVGKDPIMQAQLHELDHEENWTSKLVFETNIPSLIDKSKPKEFIF